MKTYHIKKSKLTEVPDINSVRQTQGLRNHNRSSFLCEEVSGLRYCVGAALLSAEQTWDRELKTCV